MTQPPTVTEETLNHLLVDSKIVCFVTYPPSGLHIFLDSGAILTMYARDDGELDIDILGPHEPERVACYECEVQYDTYLTAAPYGVIGAWDTNGGWHDMEGASHYTREQIEELKRETAP